ncbi:hypothetical protein IA854_13765 [Listeria seeligeri]|uniref:Uncharacterized protein n=1 Tax=Listeria seeligeri TaxID=1640 RepID=A0A7T0MAV2_LISSE|nr:hypothetical protein [Listeria seeligeri]MBC1917044.1 hypothetical protein [Listeria seeligeri]MBC1990397.1 hypothetical protein [Listeria seeligeri]MBF2375210.1 hypothetical protein [Listeria seeligeri]QPL19419.1 hypothetical protein pLIS400421c [Listeria seeligeri]UCK61881.1 hypothetical protein pLIS51_00381c [Listeria seeligeri]
MLFLFEKKHLKGGESVTTKAYTKAERNKTKSLLNLYFESEGVDKEDGLHEIILHFLEQQTKYGISERDRPHLERLRDLQQQLNAEKTRNHSR